MRAREVETYGSRGRVWGRRSRLGCVTRGGVDKERTMNDTVCDGLKRRCWGAR